MDRYLLGLLLALASTAVAADCKQDCKDAYTQCSAGATSLDDTMQCKKQYKECVKACDASGIAANGFDPAGTADRACDPAAGPALALESSGGRLPATR
jgi:hypothetical protein